MLITNLPGADFVHVLNLIDDYYFIIFKGSWSFMGGVGLEMSINVVSFFLSWEFFEM